MKDFFDMDVRLWHLMLFTIVYHLAETITGLVMG